MRATIRSRLTLTHAGVFALMAVALVAGIYALTARSLTAHSPGPRSEVERALGLPAGSLLGERGLDDGARSLPSLLPDRRTLRRVATGVQTETRSSILRRLIVFSAVLVSLATLITAAIGWLIAGRSLRPLRRITARARTLSERNLHEPIALSGPHDELRELADTFDEMLFRLDRAFAGQRLFAANASHELRTPLTRIRTKLDVTLTKPEVTPADIEDMATTIRDAIDRSAALIDSLLMLAKSQGEIQHQPVAIDSLVDVVLTDLRATIVERGIVVATSLAPSVAFGDPMLLEHLVRNVLENAVRHNAHGGWIDVETHANDVSALRVANAGPVVEPSSIDGLFVPLHRGQPDRTHLSRAGFGLGLAIVKAIVETHRGHVRAAPLAGGGLVLEVALPIPSSGGEVGAKGDGPDQEAAPSLYGEFAAPRIR